MSSADTQLIARRLQYATPMMRQYLETKAHYAECLLFYRMGDFYELFFEDAEVAAAALNIALTKRGAVGGEDIPMCGVPHHSYVPYLNRLIAAGHKVAVCEQMETPDEAKKRGSSAVIKREVIRIVTQGTLVEDELLDGKSANYLAAVAEKNGEVGLAWADVSTGETGLASVPRNCLKQELVRISPKELLISDKFYADESIKRCVDGAWHVTPQPFNLFAIDRCEQAAKNCFGVETLKGLGDFSLVEKQALGVLAEYISVTQCGSTPRLVAPKRRADALFTSMDAAVRQSLELSENARDGGRKGTLLEALDFTASNAGARLLRRYVHNPLCDPAAIGKRQDVVQDFVDDSGLRRDFRERMRRMTDLERRLARICLGKGSPADLLSIRNGLYCAMELADALEQANCPSLGISEHKTAIGGYEELLAHLMAALANEPTGGLREGGFIAGGYDEKLDEARSLSADGDKAVIRLQDKYRQETGVKSLKVKRNNVLGWHIDVPAAQAESVKGDGFFHRQTLANAVRFCTDELRELERKLDSAQSEALRLEREIFERLANETARASVQIAATAYACACLDVAAGFAECAVRHNYVRPIVDDSLTFDVKEGRHPVIERQTGRDFVANDCNLSDAHRLWLITGPNMAGKSTFLRQNALIALMAQIGAFVPAAKAHIGAVDRLFSRVGATDNPAEGHSTFMVEMTETAAIVNNATERSLVIMDEIGRGTSTYDGVSIAWAVVEHVAEVNQCRALCATHYHELTQLAALYSSVGCYGVTVREWEDGIVFLHRVEPGGTDRSYGVHVGKIAGLPSSLIARAYGVMERLEAERENRDGGAPVDHVAAETASLRKEIARLRKRAAAGDEATKLLSSVSPDDMSPKEALSAIYALKRAFEGSAEAV